MKVAVISSHTPSLFWFRMDMMQCFQDRGCDVIAIGNEDCKEWSRKFSDKGIRYVQANIQRNGTNPLRDLISIKSLYGILKQEHPDKIFTYQAKSIIYGGIAAKLLGISDVFPLIAGLGSIFLKTGIKAKLFQCILRNEYRLALCLSKAVFFQNRDDVSFFLSNKIVNNSKVQLINGSGVNLNKFTPLSIPDEPAFLCISRLIRDKGVGEYLEAARIVKKDHPNARFLLVGPYDTNPSAIKPEELQRYIDDDIIEYFGEQEDVRPYFAQCSIYVLPSYREGTPKTVLEAMACGRAVITTNAPGCKETVVDGVNGALVPVKDAEALAEKMKALLSNPERVKQMASAGRKMVEEKFDVSKVDAAICAVMGIE